MSTIPNYYSDYMTGTSMSAPHVSGVAGLVFAVNPILSGEEASRLIEMSATKFNTTEYQYTNQNGKNSGTWNSEVGYGLLNAECAVKRANIAASSNLPAGNYSISIMDMYGSPVTITNGVAFYTDMTNQVFLSLNLPQNNNYTYFWQVRPAQGYTEIPFISPFYSWMVSLNMPSNVEFGTMFKIRCCIFDGMTLVAAPSFDLLMN